MKWLDASAVFVSKLESNLSPFVALLASFITFISSPFSPRQHDTKRSVFLGNLPFDVGDDAVREHFVECGTVENVRIVRDAKTGLGKGFGYLLFAVSAIILVLIAGHGQQPVRP